MGWRAFELKVSVSADSAVYRTRERARVRIAARTANGQAPPAGTEVALAAVDEGLLELAGNPSWNLLEAMMRRRSHAVETATAQMHVVGKRHYGLKALPQGGGGGRQPTRELFDTLLLWQARVRLDADGAATVEVPLNDSITAFRIVAVASGGEGLFGTGATSIRTTQDLMVLPGIAPLAREGDRMRSEVTLRNATDRPMDVAVTGAVTSLGATIERREVSLAPGQAQAVGWDVVVPAGVTSLRWELEAGERGGAADKVAVTQKIVPAVPVRGTGLARQSRIATDGEQGGRRFWPAYEEKSFESFRAYYAYVPKGGFTVEYTVRLNQGGRFELPATRVEALYAPEMFGELPNRPLEVAP